MCGAALVETGGAGIGVGICQWSHAGEAMAMRPGRKKTK